VCTLIVIAESMHVILLLGAEGVGKSTVAQHMVEHEGYTELTFAGPLRHAATKTWNDIASMLQLPTVTISDTLDRTKKEQPLAWHDSHPYILAGRPLTPRWLIQWFGTEVIRNQLDENVWVNAVVKQMKTYACNGRTKFILSDYRFANEGEGVFQYLHTVSDASWTIACLVHDDDETDRALRTRACHESQRGWITLPADLTIRNPFVDDQKTQWLYDVAQQIKKPYHAVM